MMRFLIRHNIHCTALVLALLLSVFSFSSASPAKAKKQEKLSLGAGISVSKSQALYQEGRVLEAIQVLEDFINRSKSGRQKGADQHYIPFLLGNYYASLPQDSQPKIQFPLQKAAQCYRAALDAEPLFAEAWLNLARCSYEARDFKEAARAFEKGYEHSETKKAVHLYYAAVCRFQAQEHEKALELFNTLLKAHPDAVSLAWKEILVNILFSLERYHAALPHLEELAEKHQPPKQKKWQEILLYQYLSLEMDDRALAFAEELTRADPLEPKWWKGMSHIHLKNRRTQGGLSALVIYGFLTPLTRQELELAADLYLSLDIPQKAASLYQSAMENDPDPHTLEKLVQAFAMAHDPDNAVKWIDKGLTSDGVRSKTGVDLLMMKAQLLYMKRSWVAAADAYEKAAEHNSASEKSGQAWLMSGYSSMNGDKLNRAEKAFKKAARFKKQQKQALAAITQIQTARSLKSIRTGQP